MNEFTQNIDYYIDQYELEKQLYKKGKEFLKCGWLNKSEFLTICLWKSRRPKKLYNLNSEEEVKRYTKLSFSENDEREKIRYLINLKGVRIPTASAILSVVDPKRYPIIDERCIQSLNDLKIINWKTITENNWLAYLKIIRNLAEKYKKDAREIEKGLFAYNRIKLDNQYRNLYNNG